MATKPSVPTEWATQFTNAGPSGNANKQEPTQPFKDFGQPEAAPVDRQSLNYELNALDQWRVYLEEKTDELSVPATTTAAGLIELATQQEALDGTDANRAITPSTMQFKLESIGLASEGIGLGSVVLDNAVETGFFSYENTDPSIPIAGFSGCVIVLRGFSPTQITQLAYPSQQTRSFIRWSNNDGTSWSAWAEDFNTTTLGQSTETVAGITRLATLAEAVDGTNNTAQMTALKTYEAYSQWGLGSETARDTSDWNQALENGFWKSDGPNTYINSPDNTASGWVGFTASLNLGNKRQIVFRTGVASYEMWLRHGTGDPLVWGAWIPVVTADNINTFIPDQVTYQLKSTANLQVNTKNILDLDTLTSFNLPSLALTPDYAFVIVRPSVSSLTPANFDFLITADGSDTIRTRDIDKNIVTDTSVSVDLMTEITFLKINGAWEY